MNLRPRKTLKLRKIDAVIVIILIVIAGLVLTKAGYVILPDDDPDIDDDPIIEPPPPPPPTPPTSIIPGFMRAVSGLDEGVHFDKIRVCREWWYYSVIFDEDSELAGWTAIISFNHMARGDLLGTLKPDLLVVTLFNPDGEVFGGMINKKRGMGILSPPTLNAKSPGVSVTFEDSWAEGRAPEWHVHAEDAEIDNDCTLVIDLRYFAPAEPIKTIGDKSLLEINNLLASYVFTGCNVTGTVELNGETFNVQGKGHHEHSWSPNIVTRGLINGWDWFHITLENGWNVYLSNYYPTPQFITSATTKTNPISSLLITTDDGKTITSLEDIEMKITESDEKIFPFVRMPTEFSIHAKPGLLQPLLQSYSMSLELDIKNVNTYDKVWKFPTYVGMKTGLNSVKGTINWSDDDGDHSLDLNGLATTWSMRALF